MLPTQAHTILSYASSISSTQIKSITVADVRSFLSTWQRPDSAVLGIVGDFESNQMLQLVKQTLEDWAPAAGQPPQALSVARPPPPPQRTAGKVFLVDKPEASQASTLAYCSGVCCLRQCSRVLGCCET